MAVEYDFGEIGSFPKYEEDRDKYVVFACAKHESPYIREWVEHYLGIGFDKIFIADNNEPDDNSLYEAISDYVHDGKVQIFDCRGKHAIQVLMYSKFCEIGHYKWCGYFDCDEFFEMGVYDNVKEFLGTLDEYDCISFNWLLFGPNGETFKKDGRVVDRFPKPVSPVLYLKENVFIKSIVKGGEGRFPQCTFNGSHVPTTTNPDIKYSIGGYNEPYRNKTIHAHYPPSYKLAYIRHYYTKSYEEWRVKAGRGWPDDVERLDLTRFSLFNETYGVPVENFLSGLFNDTHKTALEWKEILDSYSVIKLTNGGEFVYPFIMSTISLMCYGSGRTFVFADSHIDDAMYAIFLEYSLITGNKICFVRNDNEMWRAYEIHHKWNEPTYYIIGYS